MTAPSRTAAVRRSSIVHVKRMTGSMGRAAASGDPVNGRYGLAASLAPDAGFLLRCRGLSVDGR